MIRNIFRLLILMGLIGAPVQAQVKVTRLKAGQMNLDALKVMQAPQNGGTLAFFRRVPVKGGPQTVPFDLMLVKFWRGSRQNVAAGFRVTPPISDVVFDPQFSPDGERILFKVGWPFDRHDTFAAYVLTLKTGAVSSLPLAGENFRLLKWAPDSKHLAYVSEIESNGSPLRFDQVPELHVCDADGKDDKKVAQSRGATAFNWASPRALVFCDVKGTDDTIPKVDIQDGKRTTLVQHALKPGVGFLPTLEVSPDGAHLAYYGAPQARAASTIKIKNLYTASGLCILDCATGRGTKVGAITIGQPRWVGDNQLVTVKNSYAGTAKGEYVSYYALATVTLSRATGAWTAAAHTKPVVVGRDIEATSQTQLAFFSGGAPMGLTARLFEAYAREGDGFLIRTSLYTLSADGTSALKWAEIKNQTDMDLEIDWHSDDAH